MPDSLFREAKAAAARKGQPLRQLVAEAIEEKLQRERSGERPWMNHFGALSHLSGETKQIEELIEREFEVVDPEDWK